MNQNREAVSGATVGGLNGVETDTGLRLTIPTASHVATARSLIRRWLGRRLAAEPADEVLLACGEAVDNALEHGRPPITLEMSWNSDGDEASLTVFIRDTGTWRVSAQVNERGLGIPIMMALMDSLTIETAEGTAVRLSRRF